MKKDTLKKGLVYATGMTLMAGSLNLSIFASEPEGRGGFDIARGPIIDNNNNDNNDNNNNDRVNLEYTVNNVDQLANVVDEIKAQRGFIIINLNNNISEEKAKLILQERFIENIPEGTDQAPDDFYEAAPNIDGTYEINNARQLYWFANEVYNGRLRDANVRLTANVDLTEVSRQYTWRPIGSEHNAFVGTFNGDEHFITGLYCKGEGDMGLFGVLGMNAEVKNVNIDDSTVINNGYGLNGIISASNTKGGVIRNCNIINSNVFGKYEVGGISGCNNGRIENCDNKGCKVVEYNGDADESYGIAENYGEVINCENNGLVITIKNYKILNDNNNMVEPNLEEQIKKADPDAPAGRPSPEEVLGADQPTGRPSPEKIETDISMGRQAPGFES